MNQVECSPGLSAILTDLRLLQQAQGQGDTAASARNQLLVRYHEAILRYLQRKIRQPHVAEAIYSNFVTRILEGDRLLQHFGAKPGRFRDYLKTALWHMIVDYYRQEQRQKSRCRLLDDDHEPATAAPACDTDEELYLQCWRQELVNQTWKELLALQSRTGQPFSLAVRFKEEQPDIRSEALAAQVSARLGRRFTAEGIRKTIQRGRELFGELLVAEVVRSLQTVPTERVEPVRVEQELIDLGLLNSYCKAAAERYARQC